MYVWLILLYVWLQLGYAGTSWWARISGEKWGLVERLKATLLGPFGLFAAWLLWRDTA